MTDGALTPDEAAMLADALDLEHGGDLVAVGNGIMRNVHRVGRCGGQNCWVHNPSPDWPLAGRPVYWDARRRMAYRLCEHDLLHPDIDAAAYAERYTTRYPGRGTRPGDPSFHNCDGCCIPEGDR